jgi:hypothetical protein
MSESELQKAVHFLETAESFVSFRKCLRHDFWRPRDVSSDDQDWILSWFFATQKAWKQLDLAKLEDSLLVLKVSDMVAQLPQIMFERKEIIPSLEQMVYY